MQRLVALAFAVCLLAGLVGPSAEAKDPKGQPKASTKPAAAKPGDAGIGLFSIGDPVRYKNLTVFPVTSKEAKNDDRYLTLDEGLKAGTVQVFEVGAEPRETGGAAAANRSSRSRARQQEGADVNRLMVLNKSEKPLYLMPGEIIYGGQQDRTIGEEAIVPPGKKPVAVGVFCVEHGRWSSRESLETSTAMARLASPSGQPLDARSRQTLAEEAKHGKFVAHAGSLNKSGRAAVQEGKGQQEVWDKVGQANASSGVISSSGAFTANYTDPHVGKQLQGYVDALERALANQKQVVGAIVAVNGKVEAVDVFQATPLFQKLWPKLLKSHAFDAFAVVRQPGADKTCTRADASAFLRTAMEANVEKKSDGRGGLVVTKRDSEKVMSFSAGMGGGMGGFGGAVHSSGYSK